MASTSTFAPLRQVAQELRIELEYTIRELHAPRIVRRLSMPRAPHLAEQPVENAQAINRRKADNLVHSVRLGAVRR
ncbi:MAG: hypothetical protein KC438_00030 [Thermomicrobiales bacterium]|nr:hypothetical protein [Thermomicrobiales bacterium]MCO5221804.1 hypothetical protein [Thermomicrobiales bacterium]